MLNREQAKEFMKRGFKVTHIYFTKSEWMQDTGTCYMFEDETFCEYNEFWGDRDADGWAQDWEIWNENVH